MPPVKRLTGPDTDTPTDAVEDHRARLLELRDQLTERMAAASPAYTAGIARQLQAVLDALLKLPAPRTEPSPLEALRQRHVDRLAEAGLPQLPSRARSPEGGA